MTGNRPSIPAELRRRILVEAGHRCAIRACRHMDVDIHHIIPWVEGREHKYEDLIALCPNCHRKAGREEIDRKSLYEYKALLRDATDRFSKLEVDYLFKNAEVQHCEYFPNYMKIFFQRLLDAGYVRMTNGNSHASVRMLDGMDITPIQFSITDAGREYVVSTR